MVVKKVWFFLLVSALLIGGVLNPSATHAQVDGMIVAEGFYIRFWATGETDEVPFEVSFYPGGGDITGYSYTSNMSGTSFGEMACTGSFSGGDGGTILGECIWAVWTDKNPNKATFTYTWEGNLYANGIGNGTLSFTTWQITFSPDAFAAGLAPAITREYIFTTYGISVEDSFGHDGWAQKAWSDQELVWLDDVLKVIPSHLIERMALKRIVRNEVNMEGGTAKPTTMGNYRVCDRAIDPDCDGSSATIRIFDRAYNPVDFPNDPERQFKATILHELVHAMQRHKGKHEIYLDVYNSPLVQNYMDATRRILDIEHPDYSGENGWTRTARGGWSLSNIPARDKPATNYGLTNPIEDMAEAVMMYVYEPERLQRSSWQRYYFIRDEMFGGVEYENGHPKP